MMDASIKFRDALSQLRVDPLTKESWELPCMRVRNELSPEEVASFDTASQLHYTNAEVNETNFVRLSTLESTREEGRSVAYIGVAMLTGLLSRVLNKYTIQGLIPKYSKLN
jgi:hypothetical protein